MSDTGRDADALRVMAAIPFLDRLELAAVAGVSEGTAHNDAGLHWNGEGLLHFVRHGSPLHRQHSPMVASQSRDCNA